MVDVVEKKRRGRPKMTPEQKAAAKAAREAERQGKADASTNGKQPTPPKPKPAAKPPKAGAAPKRQTAPKENDPKTRFEDLTDDQQFALLMQHSRKIGLVEAALEKAKGDVKGARDLARAEIGKDALHRVKLYADLQTEAGQARLRGQMDMTMQVARWAGMPTKQGDLFEDTDRTPVDDVAHADGKRAGLAGENATPPDRYNSGVRMQKWLAGHAEGQAVLLQGFKPLGGTFGAPPPAAPAVDWGREGVKAFEAGSADTPPGDVPAEFHDDWRKGFEWARAEKAKLTPPADPIQGLEYWRGQGASARKAGEPGQVPSAVPEEFSEAWLDGWDNAADEFDLAFWKKKGADAWMMGQNGEVPDDIPSQHRDTWSAGWNEAKAAHEASGSAQAAE